MLGPSMPLNPERGGFRGPERIPAVAADPQASSFERNGQVKKPYRQRADVAIARSRGEYPSTSHGSSDKENTGDVGEYHGHWLLPVVVTVIGMFMSVANTIIVSGAMPAIEKEFNVVSEDIQWISIAYKMSLAAAIPVSAWLGERLGLRRMYLLILLCMGVTAALCGMSTDLDTLIVFRILQAVPSAFTPVIATWILYRLVPRRKLGLAMTMYGVGVVSAPSNASLLSGFMVEHLNWRWIFYFEVPMSMLGIVVAFAVLPSLPGQRSRRFDWSGYACVSIGLCVLMLALSKVQDWGWTSYKELILLMIAINLLAVFVGIELWVQEPLLDMRVWTIPSFVVTLVLYDILLTVVYVVLGVVPQFLQQAQGLTPTYAGEVLLPQALVWITTLPIAGYIYTKFGPRWPTTIGLTLIGSASLLLTRVNIELPRPSLVLFTCIWAAGVGLAFLPLLAAALAVLPSELVNHGSTYRTLVQRITASLGLALFTALETTQQSQIMADRSALMKGSGADSDPRLLLMRERGPGGLIGLWQELQRQATTQAYSNVFLLTGTIALAGAVLAVAFRWGKVPGTGS